MSDNQLISNTLLNETKLKMVQQRLMNETETQRFWYSEMKKFVSNENAALINGYTEHKFIISLIFIILSYFTDYIFPISLKANIVDIFTKTNDIYVIISSLSKLWNYTQHQTCIYKKIMKQEKNVMKIEQYYPLFLSFGMVSVNLLNLVKDLDPDNNSYYDDTIKNICKWIQVEPSNASMFQLYNYIYYQISHVNNNNEDNNMDWVQDNAQLQPIINNNNDNTLPIGNIYHLDTPQYMDLLRENETLKIKILVRENEILKKQISQLEIYIENGRGFNNTNMSRMGPGGHNIANKNNVLTAYNSTHGSNYNNHRAKPY
eukprot:273733_1